MNNEFRFFGTDEHKDSFVIFELNREDAVNAFFWVSFDGNDKWKVQLYHVGRLFSYSEHWFSPYWVKEDGAEELIDEALKALDEMPQEEIMDKIKEFDEHYNADTRPEEWFDEWDEVEEKLKGEVEQARQGSGYWPWNPNEQSQKQNL